LQDQLEEPKGEIKPIKSTFTLRIDDKGHLVGFNIKKPKPKKEKKSRRILLFRRKKGEVGASAEPAAEKPEVKGIKGKIIGIVSKIKPKKSGSKVSGIVGKTKGIFSRKSK